MYNIDKIWETIIAVLLAVFGGLARMLNLKENTNHAQLKWSKIFAELFISSFSGVMVLMLARIYGLSGDWLGVICGMTGWVGPKILDIVAKTIVKVINDDTSE